MRYAIRNEYAVSAIDVLARRTRLSFLNARAALDALPRVVEIMAEELHWSYPERQRQIENTVKFLESMGLNAPFSIAPAPNPRVEKAREEVKRAGLWILGYGRASDITIESFGPGRSRFEAGEVAALRVAFSGKARVSMPATVGGDGDVAELKVPMEEVMDILRSVPGYPEISKKELDYVVAEAGMDGQKEVDLDEFIEVCFSFLFVIGVFEVVLMLLAGLLVVGQFERSVIHACNREESSKEDSCGEEWWWCLNGCMWRFVQPPRFISLSYRRSNNNLQIDFRFSCRMPNNNGLAESKYIQDGVWKHLWQA